MRSADLIATARALERWLLPGECLLCREPTGATPSDALICDLCRSRWRLVPDPVCDRCGQPRLIGVSCRVCTAWPAILVRVRSAVWLDPRARAAVHHLKYDGWWRVTETMAQVMVGLLPLVGTGVLVPIPLSSRRLRQRGYNQSAKLAAALRKVTGLAMRDDLLRRVRDTRTQTDLTPEQRYGNVAGAFEARSGGASAVVLVDDVFTTGATLAAAAAALAIAGASRVEAVTFARTREPISQD